MWAVYHGPAQGRDNLRWVYGVERIYQCHHSDGGLGVPLSMQKAQLQLCYAIGIVAQLEYGDYYKFVVSCGIGLIVVSVGLPWLFLHEPFDLLLEASKLNNLTPLAKDIVIHRQITVGRILALAPYVSAFFGVGGIGLTVFGLLGWRKRQALRDEGETAEIKQKIFESKQMTEKEVENDVRDEVVEQHQETSDISVETSSPSTEDAVKSYLETENTFLDILERRIPEGYQLLRHQQSMSYKFDAILRSNKTNEPEYLIEFKKFAASTTSRILSDAVQKISFAADWANFGSTVRHVPMVIAVSESLNSRLLEEASRNIRETENHPTAFGRSLIRFIPLKRLDSLSSKDITAVLDTSQRLLVFSDDTSEP